MPADGNFFDALSVARDILSTPEFAQVRNAELARIRHEGRGVRWSGMSDTPRQARPLGALMEEALDLQARREAYAKSARGRFLAAIKALRDIHPQYEAASWNAHACWSRGFSDIAKPTNVGEIGTAVAILSDIPGSQAREALQCLAELLLETQGRAA